MSSSQVVVISVAASLVTVLSMLGVSALKRYRGRRRSRGDEA